MNFDTTKSVRSRNTRVVRQLDILESFNVVCLKSVRLLMLHFFFTDITVFPDLNKYLGEYVFITPCLQR